MSEEIAEFLQLNPQDEPEPNVGRVADLVTDSSWEEFTRHLGNQIPEGREEVEKRVALARERDTWPVPATSNREGYYGPRHAEYWISGLVDFHKVCVAAARHGVEPARARVLDLGCATGRITRHWSSLAPAAEVWAADLNGRNVDWMRENLDPGIRVFQNTSLPHLPLEDRSLDLVMAFSVFTHIDLFETGWLMELRRVLRPGGMLYATFISDRIWTGFGKTYPELPVFKRSPEFLDIVEGRRAARPKEVIRYRSGKAYGATVVHAESHVRSCWGRYFSRHEILPQHHDFQDVAVLVK